MRGGELRQVLFFNSANIETHVTYKNGQGDVLAISRLRLGHCALSHGLATVGEHTDGKCICRQAEAVNHTLMECANYHTERSFMQAELSETGVTNHSLISILIVEHVQ